MEYMEITITDTARFIDPEYLALFPCQPNHYERIEYILKNYGIDWLGLRRYKVMDASKFTIFQLKYGHLIENIK